MSGWPERHINGFQVQCEVVDLETGVLAIEIMVRRQGNEAATQRWSLPRFVTFKDPAAARRHAELVLSGIRTVDEFTGEPRYGIL
ncbi:hypothetical protein [Achromobacter mucicolens]|uniref:hypothetical protein n=1 Tax=Achromobacter mucicolens TaxID=1389922 RepID=UPI00244C3A6F|nr:hypothetical protein [Achromobacter mucicolens]MDH1524575.1 hypothetical protein [Achromobacter mucicolens]